MLVKVKKVDNSIVFPQANDIYKILKFVDQNTFNYNNENLKRVSLEMVSRQNDYYKNAARYLGLFEKNKASSLAEHLFKLDKNQLFISVVQLILENEIFAIYYLNENKIELKQYLKDSYNLTDNTALRRSSTVKNWVNWCKVILEENNIKVEFEYYEE